jgi:succinoglycan biosynthesis transport protein ExoP
MNDEPEFSAHASQARHVRTGKFFARLHRNYIQLFQRWWVLVICIVLALGVEAIIIRFTPAAFVSVGQMIVSIKLNIQQGSLYTEELGNFLGTQAALMQGSEVLQRAKDRVANQNPNLIPQPVTLSVNVLPKTTIFILRATGKNPEYTKAYLQACMEEYISLKKQMVARTSDTTIAGLTDQVLRLEPELQKCDVEMEAFLATNDVALMEQANGVGNYLTALYQQMASAQSESALLESMTLDQNLLLEQDKTPAFAGGGASALMNANASGILGTGNGLLVNAGLAEQSGLFTPNTIGMEYLAIKQQILLLNADRARFAEYLKPKHPQMVALDQELARLGRMLDIYKQQSVEQLDAKKSALALQIQNLENQTKQRGKESLDLSRKSAQYERLKAKSTRIQSLYDQLLATLETLDVNKEISPESVTIYEPASDSYPQQTLLVKGMVMAALFGLVLGVAILILLDRVDDRMNSFSELEELFDEDVLGQIPRQPKPTKDGLLPLVQPDDARHPFVEAYRNLRSSLLFMEKTGKHPRTILITSSVPGDGKSVTATNLAMTLAMGGSRVLLVDGDLRKGNLHKRLELPAGNGLSEVFSQGIDWHTAVRDTAMPNLRLLPRGATTQRSSEYFIGPVMEKFLHESAAEYDYVLIDTAPVMAADDVTSLAPRVDSVIFVVRAEYTSSRVARAALDMLYQRKARVLGLVFNSVRATMGDYYYYNRYKDYYHNVEPETGK